jgi:hypothetical protein
MNVEVAVGSIGISLKASVVEPTVTSSKILIVNTSHYSPIVSKRSSVISINGHSLSAINPDSKMIGGETTLIAA